MPMRVNKHELFDEIIGESGFFFRDRTVADHLFKCEKLDGVCSSSTDLKIITIFRYVKRCAIFLSNTCGAIVKKKKKRKEKQKRPSIARTTRD